MKIFVKSTLIIFLVTVAFIAATPLHLPADPAIDNLKENLLNYIHDEALQSAYVGVAVASTRTSELIFRFNEKKLFVPASNMKLFTTAAALLELSPDFSYKTTLSTDGKPVSGTLEGNLIITASGDPTISGYFNGNNPIAVFEQWADDLHKKGITAIHGDIIVDNSAFQDKPLGEGWHWDDLDHCYAAPKDAFSFNNNCLAIIISPGNTTGFPVKYRLEPDTEYFTVVNNAVTGPPGSENNILLSFTEDRRNIALKGSIPSDHDDSVKYLAIKNPPEFGVFVFKEILKRKGISFTKATEKYLLKNSATGKAAQDEIRQANLSGHNIIFSEYRSPGLSEIIKVINKLSNNFYAEQLFLSLAENTGRKGNSSEASLAVQSILRKNGIDLDGFFMVDGSGLSRLNLITPELTVRLLQKMKQSALFIPFYESLAITGIDDTPAKHGLPRPFENNARTKTGTMKHIKNLSGYITTKDGELLAFSLLCNNCDVPSETINKVYTKILARLAMFSRRIP